MPASLRSELNHQHAASIDLLRHNHHQELAAAKMELERSIDISRRQVSVSTSADPLNLGPPNPPARRETLK